MASRFLREIPVDLTVKKGGFQAAPRAAESSYTPRYAQPAVASKPSYLSSTAAPAPSKGMLELNRGDMVRHSAFGDGLVLSVMKMGGDALVEIAFDQFGTKKLMAKAASVHMKKL